MLRSQHILKLLVAFTGLFFISQTRLFSQQTYDSLNLKLPKHYFNTIIVLDAYRKPEKDLKDTADALSKRLKTYGIRQFNFYIQAPLFTKDKTNSDGSIRNSHVLLTGNFVSLRPVFEGLSEHNLIKYGIGLRYIYNTGKKGVWFVDVSPFVTRDITYPSSESYYRLASTLVYSHNVSDKFNWRLGITKSFMYGNRLYLPFIGFRFGRLDKVNLSVQFPRSISLNVPMGSKVFFSAYTRAQGGMFNFSNHDTLYYRNSSETFHFTRREINTGVRFDFRLGSHFSFYAATGLSTRNNLTFYSDYANKRRASTYNTYFYSSKVPATLFLNLGLVLRFGKTRSYYNNKNIYEATDLNNTLGKNNGNIQIPLTPKKKSDLNLKSIEDLVDYNDF